MIFIFPLDILKLIISYAIQPEYKLLDWININNLNFYNLSLNANLPFATKIIKKYSYCINWGHFLNNPNAHRYLDKNIDLINCSSFSANPSGIDFLEKNFDKIDWYYLAQNSAAFELLKKFLDSIDLFDSLKTNNKQLNVQIVTNSRFQSNILDNSNPDIVELFLKFIERTMDKFRNKQINKKSDKLFEKGYEQFNWIYVSSCKNYYIVTLLQDMISD